MAKRVTVVLSQGQSGNPAKRQLEEGLVGALLMERGIEVTVIPHLYDLQPDGTGMLCLQGIQGDMIVLSWLYSRAAHWILDRNQVKGQIGEIVLKGEEDPDADDESDDEAEVKSAEQANGSASTKSLGTNRKIYCLDLRARDRVEPFVEEIRRIVAEGNVKTVSLLNWIGGSPQPQHLERFLTPANGNVDAVRGNLAAPQVPGDKPLGSLGGANASGDVVADGAASDGKPIGPVRIAEEGPRRWYPVIDFGRCTNCMECLDFCLFGVYGVDRADSILVEQPDNCRKGCPACSRVCPENAIIFPQHKTPAIAGSPEVSPGSFKIDLSKLFGAPDAMEVAAMERDTELVAVGRDAVGLTVGIPKRQEAKSSAVKDDLDSLMDQLDGLDL